jgi:hypothetical protein
MNAGITTPQAVTITATTQGTAQNLGTFPADFQATGQGVIPLDIHITTSPAATQNITVFLQLSYADGTTANLATHNDGGVSTQWRWSIANTNNAGETGINFASELGNQTKVITGVSLMAFGSNGTNSGTISAGKMEGVGI